MSSWSLLRIQTNLLWCKDEITLVICVQFVFTFCVVVLFLHSLREEEEDEQLNNMMKNFSKCLHQSPTQPSIHIPTSTHTLFISYLNPTVTATNMAYKLSNWGFPSWMCLIELDRILIVVHGSVCVGMCECATFWVPLADVFHHIWSNDR